MALHGPLQSPLLRKVHNPASPTKILRHDAFQEQSSPRPSVDRKKRGQPPAVTSTERLDISGDRLARETSPDNMSPIERTKNNDDGEDPHDLSFSPKHALRASIVDSMVMSLDQFAGASQPYSNSREGGRMSSRRRGHTVSSSVGSESEVHENLPQFSKSVTRNDRRNSAARYQKDPHKLPSIFGDDEDSVRARVYDAQRAAAPSKASQKKHDRKGKSNSRGSASSSMDLGHLAALPSRLGPAGNRRSQSFDFGSRTRRDVRSVTPSPLDVAPTPVVFAGPEAQSSPMSPSFGAPQILRKNSTRSSKSAYGRKGKGGTLGTTAIKGKGDEAVPEMPSRKVPLPPSNYSPERKPSFHSPTDAALGPRPGFFRRVFGTTKIPTTNPESSSTPHTGAVSAARRERDQQTPDDELRPNVPVTKLQKAAGRGSTDISTGKENFATITKKSSAFFRRRKKSVSNIPPPLPLTLSSNLRVDNDRSSQASPVSSLRAFMDPYLADEHHHRPAPLFASENGRPESSPVYYSANSTPQLSGSFDCLAGDASSSDKSRPVPKLHMLDGKKGSTLRIPHQESFLADSSSTDDPSKKSRHETPSPTSDRPKTSPTNRLPVEYSSLPTNKSHRANLTGSRKGASPVTRPSIPPRQESWKNKNGSPLPLPTINSNKLAALSMSIEKSKTSSNFTLPIEGTSDSPLRTGSDSSEYKSAPSTPLLLNTSDGDEMKLPSPRVHVSHPSMSENKSRNDNEQARRIFDNQDGDVDPADASAWLGEAGSEREHIRKEYMRLFDWSSMNILAALHGLCDRIALRGETQQVDRMLDAFAQRWCECNPNHGFKSSDVVHTVCYSVLLLNTDLHLADIGQKMTRTQFLRNTLPTIKRVAEEADVNVTIRGSSPYARTPTPASDHGGRKASLDPESAAAPNIGRSAAEEAVHDDLGDPDATANDSGPLVDAPFIGTDKAWEAQVEVVLKSFYNDISRNRLPLFGAAPESATQGQNSGSLLSMTGNMLRRTPSTMSKAPSDTFRGRATMETRNVAGRWASKTRSRPRLGPFGSSRTSLDEQSSAWSPSMSSTWSKASLGKTLTAMSVDSFGSEVLRGGDYQSSIGFASALSQAIIREDQLELPFDDVPKAGSLLEDDSLELCGAPWAKEGILKHKCHLDGVDKRSKDRNWNDCFAVIEKGWMRLFSFQVNAKSMRQKAKNQKAGAVVGGGNWQDNAEEVFKFLLRHTIASGLPPPGYSKARPYVWALSLPTGAVHLFSVGTPDIVKEFVSTANYWSARLSKEPMMGGVSNMEYGWSDNIINRNLMASDLHSHLSLANPSPRPSTQLSVRSSIDQGTSSIKPRLPGDKVTINDWVPPQQSMMASQLMEVDQLRNLQAYVKNVEDDLQKHNELRPPMVLAFSARHPNTHKAMANWEKKSAYLLREIVKFRTYIDILQTGQSQKEKIYAMRKEDKEHRRQPKDLEPLDGGL